MSRPPCKFHNTPQGCRKGPSCHFSHRNPEGSPSPSLSTGSNVGRSARPQPPASDAPPGTCRFFWTSGRCNREFACRYRHTLRQQDSTSSLSTPSINHSPQNLDTIAPFLTEAGLAKLTSTGSDIFFSNLTKAMSPNEAHNSLKRFLYDDFRFRKTFDAYAFLTPLNSANSSNSTWTAEDGQLLLTSIATGNGLLRINDIIRWTPVSTQAGSSPFTLSFQRGYLPLLRLYSSDIVVKSTLSHLVNGLYMGIMDNFDHFCDQLENCMEAIMVAYSFKDPSMSTNNDPLGSQVIVSLASIFFECLTRFKNVTATHPRILPIVRRLQLWTDTWIAGVSSSPPLFDDPFKGTRETTRSHILDYLKGKIERLIHIANREQAKIDRAEKKAEERLLSTSRSQTNDGILSALRITYDGPGELRAEGKRHDNDFVDIQDIRVAPTQCWLKG